MHFLNKFLQKGFTIFFIFVSTTVLAQTKSLNQLFTLSTEAIQKGNFQLAAQFLQEIFKKDSNNIAALNNATYVYGKLKNYSSAIQCSKKLAALQPENANHFTNTGWFLLLNYEYEEAEMYCLKALEINNCSYINYLNLGHVYSFLKQYDKGVNYYYKALAYLPNKAAYESVMQDFDLFETNGNFPYKITNYKNMVVNYYNKSFLTMLHGTDVLDSIYQLTVLSNYLDSDEKVTALKEKFLIEENKNEYVRLEVLRDFYWSLGWMHLRNGSKSIAINNYFGSVLKISNDLKDTSFNIDVLYKLGLEYDLTAGLNLINQALTLAKLSNNYNKQYIINLLLGDKYLDKQYPDSALIYFRKAYSLSGELGRYDILHFAVHGISSMEDYRDNTLIVSEIEGTDNDGFLQYNEIANLHLNADLVCLSACETSAGLPSEDEDVKNLPIAFFLAGAKAVIATWWKIDDEASGIFMSSFYRFVFKENKSYGEALLLTRQNFISGMYGERFKSPYYWAAFKFFGN